MRMRSSLASFLAVAAMFVFGPSAAKAQTAVTLNLTTSAATFTSGASDTATVTFSASGTATSTSPSGNYSYSLTGGPVTLTESAPNSDYYTASNTPLTLTLTGTGGTTGSLTGTVELVDFDQTNFLGVTDTVGTANVTVTSASGTLAQYASAGSGVLTLNLHLTLKTAIDELSSPETARLNNGTMLPTPEPETMLLFGTGLFLVGAILRRRLV